MTFDDDLVLLHAVSLAHPAPLSRPECATSFLSLQSNSLILARMSQEFSGRIEFAASFAPRPEITHALFDFDGTLSLIREGWPVVMLGMFTEMLPGKAGDTADAVRQMLFDD